MPKKQEKVKSMPLDKVVLKREFYPRHKDDWVTVCKYVDAMKAGAVFPPIDVVRDDDGSYVVLDGWHRVLAARRLKSESIKAIVHKWKDKRKWAEFAATANMKHGRALTVQDRALIANRLKKNYGFAIPKISQILQATDQTVKTWLVSRIVEDETGQDKSIKSATLSLAGTNREQDANKYGGPIANANARRTLDEMLALLRAGLVDVNEPAIRDRATEISSRLAELLKGKKRKAG